MTVVLTWHLGTDLRELLSFPFMVNALRAGGLVAVLAGAIGYFMVLRRQSFAGHTLAVIGFPGAAGAAWVGVNPAFGYFGFCVLGALAIASVPSVGRSAATSYDEQSAVIGVTQAFALATGLLFVNLYHGFLTGLNDLLFGTITGISSDQVLALMAAAALALACLALMARPLLFSTIDPQVAQARGVPVGWLGALFLVLLGVAAASASQVTGSLLVFALLVAPAATATRLTARPGLGVLLSVLIALVVTWAGEAAAYFSPYPIGFWVTTFGFAAFLLATAGGAVRRRVAAA